MRERLFSGFRYGLRCTAFSWRCKAGEVYAVGGEPIGADFDFGQPDAQARKAKFLLPSQLPIRALLRKAMRMSHIGVSLCVYHVSSLI